MKKEDLKNKLKQKSNESAAKTDVLLDEELTALKKATRTNLESIRPKITDQDSYNKLITIVEEANKNNINIGTLKERIEKARSAVVTVAKEASKFIKFL